MRRSGTSRSTPTALARELLELIPVPLHLALLEQIDRSAGLGALGSLRDLYDRFWDDKRKEVTEKLGREPAWTATLDVLSDYMSEQQILHAPRELVDDWESDVQAMLSSRVLLVDGQRLAFFHETFFDYVFARRFSGRRRTLKELLDADQFLFRRAQVRQILSHARDGSSPEYARSLEFVLTDPQSPLPHPRARGGMAWDGQQSARR